MTRLPPTLAFVTACALSAPVGFSPQASATTAEVTSNLPATFVRRSIRPELVAVELFNDQATIPPEPTATAGDAGRCGLIAAWVKGR